MTEKVNLCYDQLKVKNWSAENFKKAHDLYELALGPRHKVMWMLSVETLF